MNILLGFNDPGIFVSTQTHNITRKPMLAISMCRNLLEGCDRHVGGGREVEIKKIIDRFFVK